MSKRRDNSTFNLSRGIKKFFLSAFVVISFIAYAVHERLTNSNGGLSSASAAPDTVAGQGASNSSANDPASNNSSQLPASSSNSSSQKGFKDGTYIGPEIDVVYGLVKVQATIQSGKIDNVQFLEYPSDRRTSQQINSIAMPYLQQEALQAQSANVDIISGATLTSEGFAMSLQSALASAH